MPLTELPVMKALLGDTRRARGKTTRAPTTKTDPKTQLATLMPMIIDKLQLLALRRPRALIIVAQVLDELLRRQLKVLDADDVDSAHNASTNTRVDLGRSRRHRRASR
jgi:glyceraldehyde-3-phosphate dehydrogenase/erythrose-4-phosphate dehydrogenase